MSERYWFIHAKTANYPVALLCRVPRVDRSSYYRKLVAYLRKVHGRIIRIGRETLRSLLARRGVTFQRTKTWKESPGPGREAKLDRIEEVLDRFPDGVFAQGF